MNLSIEQRKKYWKLLKYCFKTIVKLFILNLAEPVFSFRREKKEKEPKFSNKT